MRDLIVTPFRAEDFFAMEPQPAQAWVREQVSSQALARLEGTNAWTGRVAGEVVWIFGCFDIYPTRGRLWAFVAANAGPHFTAIHRRARAFVESLPHHRLEAEVDCDFDQGHRWMEMLGFTLEAPRLCGWRADGGDSALYGRVKQWRS